MDEITLDHKQNNRPVNKKLINEDFRPLIGKDMTMSELYKYLNCDRPSRNTFINILYRVRFCEGYTFDDLNGTLVFGIDTDNKDDGFIFETEKENEIKLVL